MLKFKKKNWDICEISDNFEGFLFSTVALTINIFVVTIIRIFLLKKIICKHSFLNAILNKNQRDFFFFGLPLNVVFKKKKVKRLGCLLVLQKNARPARPFHQESPRRIEVCTIITNTGHPNSFRWIKRN